MAVHAEIMHQRPHWYLWGLAVDPQNQGQGTGTALLRAGLQQVDAQGMPCYLETHAEQNVAFYSAEGFEVVRSVQVPDSELSFWCMLREAHQGGTNLLNAENAKCAEFSPDLQRCQQSMLSIERESRYGTTS